MAGDEFDLSGPLFKAVCEEALTIAGSDLDPVYLYAEVEEDSIFAAIFVEGEQAVQYHGPTPNLFRLIREAWSAEQADKRWFVLHGEIFDGQFDTTFEFSEDFLKRESPSDRCCMDIFLRYPRGMEVFYPPLADYRERKRLARKQPPTAKARIARDSVLLGVILGEAARLAGARPDDMFIHAVIGDRWSSTNIYHDEGDLVRYHPTPPELTERIWQLWEMDEADDRWSIMEMGVDHGAFSAFFLHPGEIDVEASNIDWRQIALRRRYDDKPVIYPPIPAMTESRGDGQIYSIHFCSP
ncbi:MAG TPA: hypothetical protein VF475_17370 [Sphingobium sp.]